MENTNKITLILAAKGLKTVTIIGDGTASQCIHRSIYPNQKPLILGYQANFFVLCKITNKEQYLDVRALQMSNDIIFQYQIDGVDLGEFSGTWLMAAEFSVEFSQMSYKPQIYLKSKSNAIFPGVELIEG